MKKALVGMGLAATLLLSACGDGGNSSGDASEPIVVSGKPWTEQYILPYILGMYIEEKTDYEVEYKDGLGEVAILTPAIENGDIDVYVEYTGTGLQSVLEEELELGESSDSVLKRVREGYEDKFNVTWLEPLGFENTYTLAYSKDSGYDAETYSDLVEISKQEEMVFGAPHAFYERPGDGYEGMIATYPFTFSETESLDPNVMYEALKQGDVDVIPAFTTDGRIERFDLQTTKDDKGFFPKYDAAPVVRMEALETYPELEDTLNELAGKITEKEMQQMNARVDIDGEKAEDVARDFLVGKGLISE
ncbi:glycine betaine ABC transporter substrate-binding protein [Paenisporosarcina cavernae]|uniref:Glycine/betaine ABC transporter substrate-binding protein n=1 Tax=Paenisporosarcina cavernae TaxID=2320858 RepID=A0A385YUQ3_9BACL|nr:glycine betaine ABC transporter substrate-binding protein [Paenisporosarcina cavernae]AYC30416.1 glycine/betaine ABC transporter substrate-binding protein [Paenisporosarcina cavernae]